MIHTGNTKVTKVVQEPKNDIQITADTPKHHWDTNTLYTI